MIFLRANGLQGPFEGPVPKNRDFLPLIGTCFARSHLRGQKKSQFYGQALQMAQVIHLHSEKS